MRSGNDSDWIILNTYDLRITICLAAVSVILLMSADVKAMTVHWSSSHACKVDCITHCPLDSPGYNEYLPCECIVSCDKQDYISAHWVMELCGHRHTGAVTPKPSSTQAAETQDHRNVHKDGTGVHTGHEADEVKSVKTKADINE